MSSSPPQMSGRERKAHRWHALVGLIVVAAVAAGVAHMSGSHAGAGTPATGVADMNPGRAPRAVGGAAAPAVAAAPARCVSGTCYVAVNVATMWVNPTYRRAVDWPARANPADPGKWVAAMTVQQSSGWSAGWRPRPCTAPR
jgi:hypothetical protein